jgi:hypothetical protein
MARYVSPCICEREEALCECGHPVRRHYIDHEGISVCPIHGAMKDCMDCDCEQFVYLHVFGRRLKEPIEK